MSNHLKLRKYLRARVVLCLVALPLISFTSEKTASAPQPCFAVGQISGWDRFEHTITIKSDSGHYSDFIYDGVTVFNDGQRTVTPEGLNVDDRICITAFRDRDNAIASRVLVTWRSQIEARDRQDLLHWEQDSVFGTVASLDIDHRRIELRIPRGSDISIDIAEPTAFRVLPAQADDLSDAVAGDWRQAAPGDELYVRGERQAGMAAIRARLIVSGGFRTFVGTVDSMGPLTETLQLRDFRSGRLRSIHFDFMPIYVAARGATPGDHPLYWATVGDLNEGDSVLVLAHQNVGTGSIGAFALITGFARAGIMGPASGESSDWIFNAIGIAGQGSTHADAFRR
jgi:hypothetical protein